MEYYLGQIFLFPYNFAPKGTLPCDGRLLSIAQNTALFSLLGTTYGGDGITTFALPDLSGRAAFGAGGPSPYQLGETGGLTGVAGSGVPGGLGLTYVIMTEGVYPSRP